MKLSEDLDFRTALQTQPSSKNSNPSGLRTPLLERYPSSEISKMMTQKRVGYPLTQRREIGHYCLTSLDCAEAEEIFQREHSQSELAGPSSTNT